MIMAMITVRRVALVMMTIIIARMTDMSMIMRMCMMMVMLTMKVMMVVW